MDVWPSATQERTLQFGKVGSRYKAVYPKFLWIHFKSATCGAAHRSPGSAMVDSVGPSSASAERQATSPCIYWNSHSAPREHSRNLPERSCSGGKDPDTGSRPVRNELPARPRRSRI